MLEAHSIEETDAMLFTNLKSSWMDPIIDYLKSRALPIDRLAARKVKRQAPHYVLIEKKLYKRSYSSSFEMLALVLG